jgi:hypothetical protein
VTKSPEGLSLEGDGCPGCCGQVARTYPAPYRLELTLWCSVSQVVKTAQSRARTERTLLAAGARAGRRNATDRLDPPLRRSPSLFAITDSSDRQALMLFRCLGGSCTGGADRCMAKQSRREEGADVWVLTSNVVRFSDLVQSKKNNFGNHGGALFSSISRKEVTADVARQRSVSSSMRRDRRSA